MALKEQVIVIGDTVANVYAWIEQSDLDYDDVRVVITPDQLKGAKARYIVLVNGWLKNKHLGEILEMLLSVEKA
jgi:hypothetical protein